MQFLAILEPVYNPSKFAFDVLTIGLCGLLDSCIGNRPITSNQHSKIDRITICNRPVVAAICIRQELFGEHVRDNKSGDADLLIEMALHVDARFADNLKFYGLAMQKLGGPQAILVNLEAAQGFNRFREKRPQSLFHRG